MSAIIGGLGDITNTSGNGGTTTLNNFIVISPSDISSPGLIIDFGTITSFNSDNLSGSALVKCIILYKIV